MSKKLLLSFIIALCFNTQIHALSLYGTSGNFWNKFDKLNKLVYVMAFFDGTVVSDYKYFGRDLNTRVDYDVYISVLDSLYNDKTNKDIPVAWMLVVASEKLNGKSSYEIDSLLNDFRKKSPK